MAYNEALAQRIRTAIGPIDGVSERKMFGGLAFMINGNMVCGVGGGEDDAELMLRLGNEGAAAALKLPHTRPMDFTGKPMRSMLYVQAEGIASDTDLQQWIDRAIEFGQSLPPK